MRVSYSREPGESDPSSPQTTGRVEIRFMLPVTTRFARQR